MATWQNRERSLGLNTMRASTTSEVEGIALPPTTNQVTNRSHSLLHPMATIKLVRNGIDICIQGKHKFITVKESMNEACGAQAQALKLGFNLMQGFRRSEKMMLHHTYDYVWPPQVHGCDTTTHVWVCWACVGSAPRAPIDASLRQYSTRPIVFSAC